MDIFEFANCEVKSGRILIGAYGNSTNNSLVEAICEYCETIRGEELMFNAMSDNREEVDSPFDLTTPSSHTMCA